MKTSEVIRLLQNLPEKDVCFYDQCSDLEFSLDRITYNPNLDKIYVEEVMD